MSPARAYKDVPRYTYEDYVTWEGTWELIDGVAYATAPSPYPKQQKIVARMWREPDEHLTCDDAACEVYLTPVDFGKVF